MSLPYEYLREVMTGEDAEPPEDYAGSIGRAIIDNALVIYDLDEPPAWLAPVLAARDEDGNTARQSTAYEGFLSAVGPLDPGLFGNGGDTTT